MKTKELVKELHNQYEKALKTNDIKELLEINNKITWINSDLYRYNKNLITLEDK